MNNGKHEGLIWTKGKDKIYKKITLKPHTWACVRSEEEKERGQTLEHQNLSN
ncbi:hypothetical protein Hdeb2414_s0010g00337961 [Helianthus debilis subsp. tardiflorus]